MMFVLIVSNVAVCCVQGAGIEIYPGSVCSLVGNGIHHCKDGILIKVSNATAQTSHVLMNTCQCS